MRPAASCCLWVWVLLLSPAAPTALRPWGPEGIDVTEHTDVPPEFTSGEEFRSFDLKEVHRRFEAEPGLPLLVRLWEQLQFGNETFDTCRMKHHENDTRPLPLCITPDRLRVPDHWVTFDGFLRAPRSFPFPCRERFSYGCPFLDGLGFKNIADRVWETVSFVFGGRAQNERFHVQDLPNRSLVYWNIGIYTGQRGTDLAALRRLLPQIPSHFFIVHHNSDNPRFPDWLLEEPKILKIFVIDVPTNVSHPKIVVIPLGLNPQKRERVVRQLMAGIENASHVQPADFMMVKGFTLGRGHSRHSKGLPRKENRKRWLRHIAPLFNTTLRRATTEHIDPSDYYSLMRHHQYVLSLPGTGMDCFRTWEALYAGRVPVVSDWLHHSVYHELPVVRTELKNLTVLELEDAWRRFSRPAARYNVGRLWMQWWMARILQEAVMVP